MFSLLYLPGPLFLVEKPYLSTRLPLMPPLCAWEKEQLMKIEHRSPTISEYKRLRSAVGWWATDENATEVALGKALFSVVAAEEDNIIGMGRIVGDGGLYYYIQDLIVHPEFQGNGVGKRLMAELMFFINTNVKPGAFIGLMAAKGLSKYYESYGFKARDMDGPGMFQITK